MKSIPLTRHPSMAGTDISAITVAPIWFHDASVILTYRVEGEISRLRLDDTALPTRSDGLWRRTCFEAFLQSEGTSAYDEFNFAPSGAWAHYHFTGYREGMSAPEATPPPKITLVRANRFLELEVRFRPPGMPTAPGNDLRLGLAAVLEQDDDSLAYWAVAHPPGKPDFHHPSGFTVNLARLFP